MKKCKCGATPKYNVTQGRNCLFAQVICPKCGAKGIMQAGVDRPYATNAARLTWDADEREANVQS